MMIPGETIGLTICMFVSAVYVREYHDDIIGRRILYKDVKKTMAKKSRAVAKMVEST